VIDSPLALATVIAASTALAFWLDYRFPALGKLGASMMAIIFGAVLSNLNIVPVSSVVYDVVLGPVTSLSIAWLLLSVDLRDLAKAGARMIGAFGVAVTGTVLGACVATVVYRSHFGDDAWRIAGALTGTYSGGSVNFVSVGREVGLTGSLFAGLNAADAVVTGLWLGATLILPIGLARFYRPVEAPAATEAESSTGAPADDERHRNHPYFAREGLSAVGIAALFATGLILVFVSQWLGTRFPQVPSILWLTTLALAVGHSPLYRDAPGAMQLGSVGLHFFFVLIGILSRVSEIAAVGFEVFYFTLIVVGVHGVVVLGIGKLLRFDIGSVLVASQASVGGPTSALAVAISREWKHLVLPGVVVGLLGYAVGTYLGLGVAYLLRISL